MGVEKLRILDGSPLALATVKSANDYDGYEQVVVQGAWKGHWQGEFQITEPMLQQMADSGNSRKVATPFDYGHATLFDSASDAAGWVEPGGFEVRGKGKKASLWARVDWTEKARTKIAGAELRYKSPTIEFNTTDRKTGRMGGASLHSIALTNTPFLHELPEVRLNNLRPALDMGGAVEDDPMNEEQLRQLATLLGLADNATAEQIIEAVGNDQASIATLLSSLDLGEDDDLVKAHTKVLELQTRSTISEDATSRIAALEQTTAETKALDAVKAAQKARKVAGDETDNFKRSLAHAKSDLAGFVALMETIDPWVAGGESVKADPESASRAVLDANQREINRRLGISDEDFIKHNPTAQQ